VGKKNTGVFEIFTLEDFSNALEDFSNTLEKVSNTPMFFFKNAFAGATSRGGI
jgi:hypothetical protein